MAGNQEATRSPSVFVGTGDDDKRPFACAAPTPSVSLPAHGSVVLSGTVTVNGQTKSFSKTIKF